MPNFLPFLLIRHSTDCANKRNVLMSMQNKLYAVSTEFFDKFTRIQTEADGPLVIWNHDRTDGDNMMMQHGKSDRRRVPRILLEYV